MCIRDRIIGDSGHVRSRLHHRRAGLGRRDGAFRRAVDHHQHGPSGGGQVVRGEEAVEPFVQSAECMVGEPHEHHRLAGHIGMLGSNGVDATLVMGKCQSHN